MIDLCKKKVLVTGGTSMIGRYVCQRLEELGARVDNCPHSECDLLNPHDISERLISVKPDYVIHAAGWNGGIEWNRKYPATIFKNTALMALNVLYYSAILGIKKVVSVLASCSYPDSLTGAMNEKDLWNGLPNQSVECHGLSKRILDAYSRQLYKEHNFNSVCCVLTNSYGPYDSYHPDKTKVVGALIRKFVEAKLNNLEEVVCWGTGAPLREFIYCEDAAIGIVNVLMKYEDNNSVINIGSGQEVSIKELTNIIASEVGYDGNIIWDTNKPDGQMKKLLDSSKYRKMFPCTFSSLQYGIKETVKWYTENKEFADNKGIK